MSEDCRERAGDLEFIGNGGKTTANRRRYLLPEAVDDKETLHSRANRTSTAPIKKGGPGTNCQSKAGFSG